MLTKIDFLCKTMRGYTLVVLFVLSLPVVSCSQNTDDDADWLIEVLNLKEGSTAAEIGAGDGSLTLAMARHVGSAGQVYSSELGADSVAFLQNVIDESNLANVTVVEGHPTQTNFPEACCDALFMRRVYHHFDDPESMNQSIGESLKIGGRLAVIDFAPSGTEKDDPGERDCSSFEHHGVTEETVVDELKKAGFQLVSSEERSDGDIYIVMEKER